MAPQNDTALEAEQQMLADGVDALEHPPVDARATPVACPRGFGLSASIRSPTSGRMRAAARWIASPSGTVEP